MFALNAALGSGIGTLLAGGDTDDVIKNANTGGAGAGLCSWHRYRSNRCCRAIGRSKAATQAAAAKAAKATAAKAPLQKPLKVVFLARVLVLVTLP